MADVSLFAIYCNVIATDFIVAAPFVAVLLVARRWFAKHRMAAESTPQEVSTPDK